jgi:hypothetical protein
VKAQDDTGLISDWSDPVSVGITQNKSTLKTVGIQLLEKIMNKFIFLSPVIHLILNFLSSPTKYIYIIYILFLYILEVGQADEKQYLPNSRTKRVGKRRTRHPYIVVLKQYSLGRNSDSEHIFSAFLLDIEMLK